MEQEHGTDAAAICKGVLLRIGMAAAMSTAVLGFLSYRPIPSACAVPAMSMPPPRSVAADAISAAERFNMLCIVFSLPLNLMFGMVLEKRY